jgi:hypothetical protein
LASLADVAHHKPDNCRAIIFDNEAYESPGRTFFVTANYTDLEKIAGQRDQKTLTVARVEELKKNAQAFFGGK